MFYHSELENTDRHRAIPSSVKKEQIAFNNIKYFFYLKSDQKKNDDFL